MALFGIGGLARALVPLTSGARGDMRLTLMVGGFGDAMVAAALILCVGALRKASQASNG